MMTKLFPGTAKGLQVWHSAAASRKQSEFFVGNFQDYDDNLGEMLNQLNDQLKTTQFLYKFSGSGPQVYALAQEYALYNFQAFDYSNGYDTQQIFNFQIL